MRDAVEVARKISIHHKDVAFLEPPVYFPQGVFAASSRSEAVARFPELCFKDGFQYEFQRRLDNAVFDRGDTQRPCLAFAFRYVYPFDRLRLVASVFERLCQLAQILLALCRKPFDALLIRDFPLACNFQWKPLEQPIGLIGI